MLQFADDFALVVESEDEERIQELAICNLQVLVDSLKGLNLKMNPEKTKWQLFSVKKHPININLTINHNITIGKTDEYKYLGITIDNKLKFKTHCNNLKENIEKRLQPIKYISGVKFGGHPNIILNITKAIIFSKIYYGIGIYMASNKLNIKKITCVYNKSIRMAMGFTSGTPIHVMYSETGLVPIKDKAKMMVAKDCIKSISINNPNLYVVSKYIENHQTRYKIQKSFVKLVIRDNLYEFRLATTADDPFRNLKNICNEITLNWCKEYREICKEKGKNYFVLNYNPKDKIWKHLKRFNNQEARLVNRLRTGFILKTQENAYWCTQCNCKKDMIHIFFYCSSYETVRKRKEFCWLRDRPVSIAFPWNWRKYKNVIEYLKIISIQM